MDLQVILIFILSILTVVLTGVGIYVILVLKEFRETIQKANLIIDDVENITNVVSNPLSIITGAMEAFKAVQSLRNKGE